MGAGALLTIQCGDKSCQLLCVHLLHRSKREIVHKWTEDHTLLCVCARIQYMCMRVVLMGKDLLSKVDDIYVDLFLLKTLRHFDQLRRNKIVQLKTVDKINMFCTLLKKPKLNELFLHQTMHQTLKTVFTLQCY